MPDKTQGELIREARESLALLSGQVGAQEGTLRELRDQGNQAQEQINSLVIRIALLEREAGESRKAGEEAKSWRWSLAGPILAAVISSFLTALLTWIIYHMQR